MYIFNAKWFSTVDWKWHNLCVVDESEEAVKVWIDNHAEYGIDSLTIRKEPDKVLFPIVLSWEVGSP